MGNKRRSSEKPLLFINQVKNDKNFSQQSYVIKKAEPTPKVTEQKTKIEERETQKVELKRTDIQSDKKRLKDKTIEEKIIHLCNLPKNMPKILCEIITDSDSYKGVIVESEDGLITFRPLSGLKLVKIEIRDIVKINLLGF
ncbi:CotO family spore coat protein [Litchfieldia alkalitelluris]|uniref:CotO family spore coat protein n=1 Tax=Litchfieldia alkalitelluris TaxID=304268 RepID=UPI000997D165|nr:CotO family spore coat protein [Litchfieldia alkalitelluris]